MAGAPLYCGFKGRQSSASRKLLQKKAPGSQFDQVKTIQETRLFDAKLDLATEKFTMIDKRREEVSQYLWPP